jgi:hypothetical protein
MTRAPHSHTATPVQRLTDEEREAHRREAVRINNKRKRLQYLAIAPHCPTCGASLLLCECPPLGAHVAQYRDAVRVLDVRTMTRKVEVR